MLNVRTKNLTATQTNAIAELDRDPITDRRWVVLVLDATVSAGAAELTVVSIDENNGNAETVEWDTLVTPAAPVRLVLGSSGGLRCHPNQKLAIRLAAAGAGNVGRLNALVCPE